MVGVNGGDSRQVGSLARANQRGFRAHVGGSL